MMFKRLLFALLFAVVAHQASIANAQQLDDENRGERPLEAIKQAIANAIPLLEKGSAGSAENRTCFTCHSQALPVFALTEAKKRGFKIDEENLQRQLTHTYENLKRAQKDYLEGRGQGGKADMAGYALWTLDAGDWKPDEVTAAVTEFLLKYQADEDYWKHTSNRPPSEASDFTTTYVALVGLGAYGTDEQQERISQKSEKLRKWLLASKPADTEDRVFRLKLLKYIGAEEEEEVREAAIDLIKEQREDGGWAQKSDMDSDAYATGSVLVALNESGNLTGDDPVFQRGVSYLMKTQLDDGSWHVVSRSKPFQKYFETGFPHGTDQFISTAASGWAVWALLTSLPESAIE